MAVNSQLETVNYAVKMVESGAKGLRTFMSAMRASQPVALHTGSDPQSGPAPRNQIMTLRLLGRGGTGGPKFKREMVAR